MRNVVLTCVIAIAAGVGSPANSQPAGTGARQPGRAQLQVLPRAQFIAAMDGEYRKLDGNRDGSVTQAELAANQRSVAVATAADRARAMFSRMDTDRDGRLSMEEFVRTAVGETGAVDASGTMGRLDVNRDQKVSLVEYRTLTLATFDRLDADKDGILSVAEQRAGGFSK